MSPSAGVHRLAMKRVLLILAVTGLALLGAAGCSTTDANDDELPWNTPAGWEGQTIGVPY